MVPDRQKKHFDKGEEQKDPNTLPRDRDANKQRRNQKTVCLASTGLLVYAFAIREVHMDLGVIVPNHTLLCQVEMLRSQIGVPFELALSDIDSSVSTAKRMIAKGAKVLVSRGGVGHIIQESGITQPVIEIPLAGVDVVQLIYEARRHSNKIALLSANDHLTKAVLQIAPMFDVDVFTYRIRKPADVEEGIRLAQEKGISVMIGGMLVTDTAAKLGLVGLQNRSPDEVVLKALREAERMVLALRAERESSIRKDLIFNAFPSATVSFDAKGTVILQNERAASLLRSGKDMASLLEECALLNAIREGKKLSKVCVFRNEQYACTLDPVIIDGRNHGSLLIMQEVSRLQKLEQKVRKDIYGLGHVARYTLANIVHASSSMRRLLSVARKYAASPSTVLIQGETGSGKELLAQSMHTESPRRKGPFVAINCTSLPKGLLESELFGYGEGAFTGARKGGNPGLFEMAHKGSLFLDEIGEIPPAVQAQLLRVLEEKTVRRLGQEAIVPVDVRVICATNKNLAKLVEQGLFREDLYYRLSVLRLDIPPLRERPEDIQPLLEHFLRTLPPALGMQAASLDDDARAALLGYSYPGNAREMRNILERLLIAASGAAITLREVRDAQGDRSPFAASRAGSADGLLRREEEASVKRILAECGDNKREAARRLGVSLSTLWRRLRQYRENAVS